MLLDAIRARLISSCLRLVRTFFGFIPSLIINLDSINISQWQRWNAVHAALSGAGHFMRTTAIVNTIVNTIVRA